MAKSNAERQAAYRARRTEQRNGSVTPADRADAEATTVCARHVYIGHGLTEDLYATVLHSAMCPPGRCDHCDAERQWYRNRGLTQTHDLYIV